MGHQAAGWFLLAGFLAWIIAASSSPKMADYDVLLNKEKVKQKINTIQVCKKFLLVVIALQVPAIFQGIYLIGSGYESFLTNADPDAMGRTAARGRGRGGIVLLIIQFFPYFLIGGYGFFVYSLLDSYKTENKRIKSLQTIYSYLSDKTTAESKLLIERVATSNPSDGTFNPEHFLAQVIDEIKKREIEKINTLSRATAARNPQITQEQPRFARDVNLQTQPVEQTSGVDAEKPIIKKENVEARPEEIDTLEKELGKAERLKERGLISEEEYQALRKKALGL